MPKILAALDIYFEQNPSRDDWTAWFSVSWADGSMSTWSVNLPNVQEAETPGIPDHEWLSAILAAAAKREVEPGDIVITLSSPNIAHVEVAGSVECGGDSVSMMKAVDKLTDLGLVVQLPLSSDVSRETNA
jgi:hypothetical protein